MTWRLQQAISEGQQLSEEEQDAIASWLLEELADERRWDDQFAGSEDKLARWAAKVRGEIDAGRVHDGDLTTCEVPTRRVVH